MTSAPDTRQRLLDAAERLFAARGIAETPLRRITAEAEANLAAVSYHFGSKQGLVREVFARRIGPMNVERLRRLDAVLAAAGGAPLPLRDVLRAFLDPAFHLGQSEGREFFVLIARAHAATDPEVQRTFMGQFDEVKERFGAALMAALPGASPEELFWRMHFVIGALCHTVVNGSLLEMITDGLCRSDDTQAVLERLVAFAEAGVRTAAADAATAGSRTTGEERER